MDRSKFVILFGSLVIITALIVVLSNINQPSTPALTAIISPQSISSPVAPTATTVILSSPTNAQPSEIKPSKTSTSALNEFVTETTIATAVPTIPPTSLPTSSPTEIPPTSTPDVDCNLLSQLVDVTIPAGSHVYADQTFRKTWSFQNSGSCTWGPDYNLVHVSGSLTYASESFKLGQYVSPGTMGQISIDVKAPLDSGAYDDSWKLYTDDGQPLLTENGSEPVFSISIIVLPASITGRILINGTPAGSGVYLSLEDTANQPIAMAQTANDGNFTLTDVPESDLGYNVVFSQALNPQFGMDKALSWIWVGPIPVTDGRMIQLGDIDISPLGYMQVSPDAEAVFSAAGITPETPITFQWAQYPEANDYWVDLVNGEEDIIWQSQLVPALSVIFDGTLSDGTHIQPDEYWWAVGAVRQLGSYTQTVYGYLMSISIEE